MATESFNMERRILSMEGSTSVYRDDLSLVLDRLGHLSQAEAEDLVATAGEDERAYRTRPRDGFLDVLCDRIDEFLHDDDGGFFRMIVHVARYERSSAAIELWFHVTRPGFESGGTWIRHMVVGIDGQCIFADIGV